MALVWSQNFSADAAPTWEKFAPFRVSGWRTGGTDSLDADYPDVYLTENAQVATGEGPSGENVFKSFDNTSANDSITALEFANIGTGTAGDINTSTPIRVSADIYFDSTAMDTGFTVGLSLYGRGANATQPYSAASCWFEIYQSTGDTWLIDFNARRWNSANYRATSHTFSRAATVGQWHTFEMAFRHCTVNDYSTNDVESDGLVWLKWNGTTIYSVENSDFTLVPVGVSLAKPYYGRCASLSYGFYSVIGPATNFALYDSLESASMRHLDLTTRWCSDYQPAVKNATPTGVDLTTLIRKHESTVVGATTEREDKNTQYDEYFTETYP